MSMAVVGSEEFSIGFMLAGIEKVYKADASNASQIMQSLLDNEKYAIVIVQEELVDALPRNLRYRITNAIKPLFVGVGHSTGTDLQDKVKRAVGIDLMKDDSGGGAK
ncbi:MAG: V-type ATP synthase subunit F [Thermoplasmata archaeon]|nr:V-type ATP synthase subunit F [Thermoplasmata archaeon]MCK5396747.1 V-type ATP synthase subunit F [Thermoplasmata archaeon]